MGTHPIFESDFDCLTEQRQERETKQMATLYYNCQLFTPNEKQPDTYFVVNDSRITERGIKCTNVGEYASKVDLKESLVTPGIGDAHVHVSDLGWARGILDLHQSRSSDTFIKLLREYMASDKWARLKDKVNCLEGLGWWEEDELPPLEEIDAITGDLPCLFHRRCLHIIYMNSAAIELLGLNGDKAEEINPKMAIVRGSDGRASGILREGFDFIKSSNLKYQTKELQKQFILSGLDVCIQAGLTQVQACEEENWLAWKELAESSQIPIRVYLSIFYFSMVNFGGTDNFPNAPNESVGPMLTADRIKLFADGALGASTAALSVNYKNKDHAGMALESIESLTEKVNKLHSLGWRIEIHVIGDASVDAFLGALEACEFTPEQIRPFRHILNHSQMIRADQIPLIKKFGLSCSIQPQFVESDAPWCLDAVPDELHSSLYTWKTFLNEGLMIHGGSDGPVEDILPIEAMRAAIERRDGKGGCFMPEQRLTLTETIELFTKGVAQGVRAEKTLGSLEPGQLADFNVWSGAASFDDYSVDNFTILASYVNGARV